MSENKAKGKSKEEKRNGASGSGKPAVLAGDRKEAQELFPIERLMAAQRPFPPEGRLLKKSGEGVKKQWVKKLRRAKQRERKRRLGTKNRFLRSEPLPAEEGWQKREKVERETSHAAVQDAFLLSKSQWEEDPYRKENWFRKEDQFQKKDEASARLGRKGWKRENGQLGIATFLAVAGMALLFMGFWYAPEGEIHHSVLIGFGEVSTFAGALFGVDYSYKYRYGKKEE